jgi:hypothetical protein
MGHIGKKNSLQIISSLLIKYRKHAMQQKTDDTHHNNEVIQHKTPFFKKKKKDKDKDEPIFGLRCVKRAIA